MTRMGPTGLAAVLLVAAPGAYAQFSTTVGVASEYDFRGVSLSARDPALQGSLDYDFGNGFALGAWASNIDSGPDVDGDIELDLYGSFTREISDAASWTAGFVWYTYPGSSDIDDYPEVFAGAGFGPFSLKQWFTHDYGGTDATAWYTEASLDVPLPAGFSLGLHAGYSYGSFWDDFGGGSLLDYSVGVGYTLSNFDLSLKLTGTDASGEQKVTDDLFNNEARVMFSVSTTLPWGK